MKNSEEYKVPIERRDAFVRFCSNNSCDETCAVLRYMTNNGIEALPGSRISCAYAWLELETIDKGNGRVKTEPCPFCGKDTVAIHRQLYGDFVVHCKSCSYTSMRAMSIEEAFSKHNRLCREIRKGRA